MAWHHILPQFYLKGFIDPTTPPRYKPFLWVADLVTGRIKRKSPLNAAAATDYYRVDTTVDRHLDPNRAEHQLSILEGEAASALRAFLTAPRSSQASPAIGMFVALLAVRGPWLRRFSEDRWHQDVLDNAQALLEEPDKLLGLRDLSTGEVSRTPFKEAIVKMREGGVQATLTRNQQLAMMWQQADWFLGVHFPAMRWAVVVRPSPTFVTSDRAVAWHVPGLDYGATDHPGALRHDGAEVTVALSSKVALLGMNGYAPFGDIDPAIFVERNAALAERFIIAPTRELLERALELRRPHLAPLAEARAQPRRTGALPSGDGSAPRGL